MLLAVAPLALSYSPFKVFKSPPPCAAIVGRKLKGAGAHLTRDLRYSGMRRLGHAREVKTRSHYLSSILIHEISVYQSIDERKLYTPG